ncbi:MAG TPA: TlpA disulfide reductase family protein [Chitinophagaceae bacterium]|nr:TlpA disulfide reductase family protein [Chitinophagaceae bacterium]
MKTICCCVVTVLFLAGCSSTPKQENLNVSQFRFFELDGNPVGPEQLRGKTVFLNIWATWCKPCRREFPAIASMMKKLGRDDIRFLFASEDSPVDIREFGKQNDYPFHYLLFENSAGVRIPVLPTTFIFDREGNLRHREDGYRNWDSPASLELLLEIAKK